MMNDESLEDLIADLSPEKLAELRKILYGSKPVTRTRKVGVKAESITRYISVDIIITCKNCGSSRMVTRTVEPRKMVHTVSNDNVVEHTIVKHSCTLHNSTNCCDDCLAFAKQMTREELECAYINLLKGV
jgi:hypothetical protein